jgi:hypothetical protein
VVYVTIDDLVLKRDSIFIDMSVFGLYPGDAREVMRILTQVFSRITFDYSKVTGRLNTLGYYFGMLAREKVHIASIPENTYILLDYPSLGEALRHAVERGERIVDLFVDTGSPLKNIYIVVKGITSYRFTKARGYDIFGRGYPSGEEIIIHVDFAIGLPDCLFKPCTGDLLKRVEVFMRDGELHIEPNPGMKRHMKALIREAIKMTTTHHPQPNPQPQEP